MNDKKQLKLIDYILGHASVDNDIELKEILNSKNIEAEIADISESFNFLNSKIVSQSPSTQLKNNIFATINNNPDLYLMGFAKRLSDFFVLPIKRIEYLLKMVKQPFAEPWESTFLEGAHFLHFDGGGKYIDAHCGIIHLDKGAKIRKHLHIGDELMFVLDGIVTADDGQQYSPGEVLVCKDQTTHSLIGNDNNECVFAVIAMQGVEFL